MRREKLAIANIHVPVKHERRLSLRLRPCERICKVCSKADDPNSRLRNGEPFVVRGLHQFEACNTSGEGSIFGYVQAQRRH
jgi:hypothetical protein